MVEWRCGAVALVRSTINKLPDIVNKTAKILLHSQKLPIDLESLPAIIDKRELKSEDKIHPNGQGYQRLGEAVFKLLQETGAL